MKKFLAKIGVTMLSIVAAYFVGMAYEQGRKKGKAMETASPAEFMSGAASTVGKHMTQAYARFASRDEG